VKTYVLLIASLTLGALSISCGSGSADEHLVSTDVNLRLLTPVTYFGQPFRESADIKVDFSDGTTSVLFYAEPTAGEARQPYLIFVSKLVAPNGTALIDLSTAKSADALVARRRPITPDLMAGEGVTSFAIPEADGPELPRGVYTVRLAGDMPVARVHVVRRITENAKAGSLDVNLFFVDGTGLSAAKSSSIDPGIDAFYAFMTKAGIARGAVAKYDIKGISAPSYVAIDVSDNSYWAPLRRLMLEAKAANNARAINVFFVRELDTPDGLGTILGVAPGIPSALTLGLTTNSGIVISLSGHMTDTGTIDAAALGRTIAHESSHCMGLYHSTEASTAGGGTHDIIQDTPECPPSADLNGDGVLEASECGMYDESNFMFWESLISDQLSPGQSSVLLHSVVVRGASQ
jgi:hypothetical protein